jgi:hypothetical protein
MKKVKFTDTRVKTGGVMRCCFASIKKDYDENHANNDEVKIGANLRCRYCDTAFTLIDREPNPIWTPDWQLEDSDTDQE